VVREDEHKWALTESGLEEARKMSQQSPQSE
jgi:hypothetical protein